jgi:hypothetical protein
MSDPFRRLPGEPPLDSATLEEAWVWVEVYCEMVMFWQQALAQFVLRLKDLTSERARLELRGVDQTLLEARCDRLRRRLALWELRARELASPDQPDGDQVHPPTPGPPPRRVRTTPTSGFGRSGPPSSVPRSGPPGAAVLLGQRGTSFPYHRDARW